MTSHSTHVPSPASLPPTAPEAKAQAAEREGGRRQGCGRTQGQGLETEVLWSD